MQSNVRSKKPLQKQEHRQDTMLICSSFKSVQKQRSLYAQACACPPSAWKTMASLMAPMDPGSPGGITRPAAGKWVTHLLCSEQTAAWQGLLHSRHGRRHWHPNGCEKRMPILRLPAMPGVFAASTPNYETTHFRLLFKFHQSNRFVFTWGRKPWFAPRWCRPTPAATAGGKRGLSSLWEAALQLASYNCSFSWTWVQLLLCILTRRVTFLPFSHNSQNIFCFILYPIDIARLAMLSFH